MKYPEANGWFKRECAKDEEGNYLLPIGKAVLNREFVDEHPLMKEEEFEAFKEDIALNGQLFPVLVWRGKIVDGRHRLRALKELGATNIKAKEIPYNTTKKEVKRMANSTEVRRHETPTQLAVKAFRLMEKEGIDATEAARRVGVGRPSVSKCNFIKEKVGTAALDKLYNGEPVFYNLRNCSTVGALYTEAKKVEKQEKEAAMKKRYGEDGEPLTEPQKQAIDTLQKMEPDQIYRVLNIGKRIARDKLDKLELTPGSED